MWQVQTRVHLHHVAVLGGGADACMLVDLRLQLHLNDLRLRARPAGACKQELADLRGGGVLAARRAPVSGRLWLWLWQRWRRAFYLGLFHLELHKLGLEGLFALGGVPELGVDLPRAKGARGIYMS